MTQTANPTQNPAADNDLPGTMIQVLRTFLMNTDDMLPVKVLNFDRKTNRANVEHQIVMVETDGKEVERGTVINIPTLFLGGGGYSITWNLQEGDKGWIKASDRDISNFLNGYKVSAPESKRIHAFENGIFIPDVMEGLTEIPEEDLGAFVISNRDFSQKISISSDRLRIEHDILIETKGNVNLGVNATEGIARVGDDVKMTFGVGVFGSTASGIQIPEIETVLTTAVINSGSVINKAE